MRLPELDSTNKERELDPVPSAKSRTPDAGAGAPAPRLPGAPGLYRVYRTTKTGRPVFATPAEPVELRLAGLMRLQAYTARRAMYRGVMRLLMRLRLDHWFADDVESPIDPAMDFDFNSWLGQVRRELGDPNITPAVFWPTESHRKRVYVHLFDRAARPVGFAKVSLNEDNDSRLEREGNILRSLGATPHERLRVPRVLSSSAWEGRRYLVLEPAPERSQPLSASQAEFPREVAEDFAGAVREIPGGEVASLSWWDDYRRRITPEADLFDRELRRVIESGVRVRRQHGDFGRHNIVLVDGHHFVFDWEEACDDAPAAVDEVTYWTTGHLRELRNNPAQYTRVFADRFLKGATPERRCDVMMALAYRIALGMSTSVAIVRNWSRAVDSGSADTYRQVFAPTGKAEEYEKSMCESRGYAEVLWQVEQEQLAGVIDEVRRTHPRIESLDFASGTGRITRFIETRVDASTAIEISPAMIEVAKRKLTRTNILCKDATAPDAEVEGKYDLITTFRFIVNAEPSLRLAGLKALAARLRDSSSVIVFNNHGNLVSHKMLMWPLHRWKRRKMAWSPDANYMTDGQVRELADKAGLKVERVMGCGLLSGQGASMLGFERAVRWERRLAGTWLSHFGGNQMYVARLKDAPAGSPAPPAGPPEGKAVGAPQAPGSPPTPGAPQAPRKREAHRAAVRIATNYVRLGINLALGMAFVPFMLHWVGPRAFGLVFLLGAGVGLGGMFREITTRSVIRELGAAYHTGDRDHFRMIFNSALVVSLLASLVACAVFGGIYLGIDLFSIPDEYMDAARVMLISQAAYMVLTTALSPVFNMMVVTERFVPYNAWIMAERSLMLLSAVGLYYWLGPATTVHLRAAALSDWSILVAVLQSATFALPVLWMITTDPQLRPSVARVNRTGVRTIGRTVGLYFLAESASALYEKVAQLIVNLFFGLPGNTVFGIAYQFVSYVRQVTVGVTFGLDAVSARLSAAGAKPLRALMHHSTRLHGLVAIPTGTAVFLLAEPLIRSWIGARVKYPEMYIPGIVTTVQIMAVSLTARAVADGWLVILYGAGYLKRYAPLVLTGGVLFPIVTVASLMWGSSHPTLALFIVPVVFCAMQFTVYMLLLPVVAARCVGISYAEMFRPLWRPALVTALTAPLLVLVVRAVAHDPAKPGLAALGMAGLAFGAAYALLTMAIVLTSDERERFVWGMLKRFLGRGAVGA